MRKESPMPKNSQKTIHDFLPKNKVDRDDCHNVQARVPLELYEQARKKLASSKLTMNDLINAALQEYVNEPTR